jgi:CO dehydrogenase maturation factor
MMIRALMDRSPRAVLAVDADPNSCFGLTMGVETTATIAEIREKARRRRPDDAGMDRVQAFEYGLQQAITEADGFDLVTMGRPEGPDCYCAVNNLLRKFLDELGSAYSFVVMDNEAGMEHLSRRTTNNVDLLCITAESTPVGAITAARIFELARELPISVREIKVIWNRSQETKELEGIETLGCVPYDQAVLDACIHGKSIFDLQHSSPAFLAVKKILDEKLTLKRI